MGLSDTAQIPLSELHESLGGLRLQAPEQQQDMERSLGRLGQISPLLVFCHDGNIEVLDGFKRLRAARTLNWAEICVSVLDVETVGAKVRLWQSNHQSGLCELEEAWLIRSLYREDGLNQVQIGQLMGRHKSWVNRRLLLAEALCEEVQLSVKLGLITTTSARELCRLPRGNQVDAANVVARRGLTTRQTAGLVDAMINVQADGPDAGVGAETLAARLQASGHSNEPARKSSSKRTPSEWLIADTQSILRLCARLQARLLDRSPASFSGEERELCAQALHQLLGTMTALGATIAKVTPATVSGDPGCAIPESNIAEQIRIQ